MGRALIKAEYESIIQLIQNWCENNGYRATPAINSIARSTEYHEIPKEIVAESKFNKAIWHFENTDGGFEINFKVKRDLFFDITLKTIMLISLVAVNVLLLYLLKFYSHQLALASLALVSLLYITNRTSTRYLIKLSRIEQTFWDAAIGIHDYQQLTRTELGSPSKKTDLLILILAFSFALTLFSAITGKAGFSVIYLFSIFMLSAMLINRIYKNDVQWQWEFWIAENMLSWTVSMLGIAFIFVLLFIFEMLMPQALHAKNKALSIREISKQSQLRDIYPATSALLENDLKRIIHDMAESDSAFHHYVSNPRNLLYCKDSTARMRLISIMLLCIQVIAIFIIVIRRLLLIFNRAKIWAVEMCGKYQKSHPYVPYYSQAWKHEKSFTLRLMIVSHFLLGGITNVAIVLLCIDAYSYMLAGKTLVFEKTANLISWIFAPCKIIFGQNGGYIAGCIIVALVSIPFLFLIGTLIRRGLLKLVLVIRIFHCYICRQHNDTVVDLQSFIANICSEHQLRKTLLLVTEDKQATLKLHQVSLTNAPVIELSQGTIDLLSTEELTAAVAHEMGHIQQGLWRIGILQFLSSLALFPNYYLTLCINWPKREIDADRFAVTVTDDVQSLKQALIKISVAQINYISVKPLDNFDLRLKWLKAIKCNLRTFIISVKFFFGDGLFGYAHPYLSERIKAIDENIF